MDRALRLAGVSIRFPETTALNAIDLDVAAGAFFGLLGPNGSGKSTLFRAVATLLRPSAGTIEVFGADAVAQPQRARESFGVVFQSPSLDGKLTVRENLECAAALYGLRGGERRARIDDLLARFDLRDRASSRAETLSGGMKRRVEIAKGLLHRPRLLLLDEPSTGLDPAARAELAEHLRGLHAQGMTIVLTTHLLDEAESCTEVALLDRGRKVAQGAPRDLEAELGGRVITLRTRRPDEVEAALRTSFGIEARRIGATLRIENADAESLLPRLLAKLGDAIDSCELATPSLEDVFLGRTGRAFHSGGGGDRR